MARKTTKAVPVRKQIKASVPAVTKPVEPLLLATQMIRAKQLLCQYVPRQQIQHERLRRLDRPMYLAVAEWVATYKAEAPTPMVVRFNKLTAEKVVEDGRYVDFADIAYAQLAA